MTLPILNLAAYRFVRLADLPTLQQRLRTQAAARGLKGTILLAEEGINLVLAGRAAEARAFVADDLASDARLTGLETKESWSATPPFKRLLVKVKREIIRMDAPQVQPGPERAPAVDATTLSRWLDNGHDDTGQPVVLLDTRNRFEVKAGRFAGAVDWQLGKFSEFPSALAARGAELAGKTVVSYCTGGIRCEKAALLMRDEAPAHGLGRVLQLDGGILKYFETVGARHFEGACTVFDDRLALDPALQPVG